MTYTLLAEEQKGCRRKAQGYRDQLVTDAVMASNDNFFSRKQELNS